MGFFPGLQKAKPIRKKPSSGGGGNGGSSPVPFKTSPGLKEEINEQRRQANIKRGVGDPQGRSPSDPNFGSGSVPTSTFRQTGGAAIISKPTPVTQNQKVSLRAQMIGSLAQRQEISQSARSFYSDASQKVESSSARARRKEREERINILQEQQKLSQRIRGAPLTEKAKAEAQAKITVLGARINPAAGMSQKKELATPSIYGGRPLSNLGYVVQRPGIKNIPALKPAIQRPLDQSINFKGIKVVSEKGLTSDIIEGIKTPIKAAGYIAGKPLEFGGGQIRKFGEVIDPLKEKGFRGSVIGSNILKTSGSFIEGAGKGWVQEPIKTAALFGVASAVGFGFQTIKHGAQVVKPALTKVLPTSLVTKTARTVEVGAILGLVGSYGVDVGRRIYGSKKRAETAGRIFSTEIIPFESGTRAGEKAFTKIQDIGVKVFSKFVPPASIVEPGVLKGTLRFPMAATPQKAAIKFRQRKFKLPGTKKIQTFHSTVTRFPKKTKVAVGGFTGQQKTIKKLFREGKSIPQISKQLGISKKSIKHPLSESEGLFIAPSASTYFLRLANRPTKYGLLPEAIQRPTILSIETSQVKRVPKSTRTGDPLNVVSRTGDVFLERQSGKDVAWISPRTEAGFTREAEAIIPKDTLLMRTTGLRAYKRYTIIEGRSVPIQEFKITRQKKIFVSKKIRKKIGSTLGKFERSSEINQRFYSYQYKPIIRTIPISYKSSPRKSSSSRIISRGVSSAISYPKSSTKELPRVPYRPPEYTPRSPAYVPSRVPYREIPYTPRYPNVGYITTPRYPGTSRISELPFSRRSTKTGLNFDMKGIGDINKKMFNQLKRPFQYQPSLVAVTKKIKGKHKRKDPLTGLEIRPISSVI